MSKADQLQIRSEPISDGVVIHPVGEIDLSCAAMLRQALGEAQTERPRRLVIDLSEVPYMDSSGVATLVEAFQIARRGGTKLVLCGLQDKVQSIFEIARLDMVFKIVATIDEAMSA